MQTTMSRWKLCRQIYSNEVFELSEGDEVTVGRSPGNKITLSSIVISRNHCLLQVKDDEILVTDLKSSNGVYVGLKRIEPNIPFALTDADIIGFGWTDGAPLVKILESEKYVFKLIKCTPPLKKSIQVHNNAALEEITEISSDDAKAKTSRLDVKSPVFETKLSLKRKLESKPQNVGVCNINNINVINISDSDTDSNTKDCIKKIKVDQPNEFMTKLELKKECEDIQYEVFNVKQEYFEDDEPIEINSDSDSETELFVRLSQSSPINAYTRVKRSDKPDKPIENSSYSQLDDDVIFNDNIENAYFIDDDEVNTVPPHPPDDKPSVEVTISDKIQDTVDGISSNSITKHREIPSIEQNICDKLKDIVVSIDLDTEQTKSAITPLSPRAQTTTITKKTQMIDPLIKSTRRRSHFVPQESKKSNSKYSKKKTSSTSKKSITDSQKEERKRKLKEIASKEKDVDLENTEKVSNTNSNKSVINVKVTTSNRGAFLTDDANPASKFTKKKDSKSTEKEKKTSDSNKTSTKTSKSTKTTEKIKLTNENQTRHENDKSKTSKDKNSGKEKSLSSSRKSSKSSSSKEQIPLKNLTPLTNSKESLLSKPVSTVPPLLAPMKIKTQVRFLDAPPEVHEFEIQPGNQMKKIGSEKTSLVDARKMPKFSLEKITLMKILRWNPQWLEEQKSYVEPPPILGHNNPPTAILHNFNSHSQYVGLVGDLLLMEIWECLTQSYLRNHNQNNVFQLRVESLPPVPPPERFIDLCNLSVNISLLKSEVKNMPRVGDIMTLEFGPADKKNCRFFFVHNVRSLPSPPNNKNSFFSLSLYATFTNKINDLTPGEIMIGRTIAYINKELMLFDAMEYLAGSPLMDAILRPQPYHFAHDDMINLDKMETQWTKTLNSSQKLAVAISVSAALGHQPRIQMIQGPPGTGKSSVICSIIMTYFYNTKNERQQNRGKILICATSNAAVDELVIRLLNIRQTLPKEERFRMVRVGRLEAMHARARDVSSQQLAQRDAARVHDVRSDLDEEISHLEAKVNMWKIAEEEAKDNVRRTYCRDRWSEIEKKILRHRGGGSSGDRVAQAERRIIECADIIVTTLASAHNHKMRALKGRIALCIVDEAGQAIEPEALIPFTLGVTRLTLIGDPQQLPGFICSQRAKQHGLGESLFSRLSSCAEAWGGGAVLLDQQYRMHAAIADYPNRAFYGGRLRSVPPAPPALPPAAPPARALPPYALVGIASGDKGQGGTYANETEAWGVARVAAALAREARARRMSLAVLTPYSAHRDLLRACLRALQEQSEPAVEVSTVDSFQGQERDVVVVSLARSCGVGFLTDTGRMNVMLTRARHMLLVCLNPLALVKNNQWQTLIEDAQKRKLYFTLPSRMCQPAPSMSISHEEVLKHIIK